MRTYAKHSIKYIFHIFLTNYLFFFCFLFFYENLQFLQFAQLVNKWDE